MAAGGLIVALIIFQAGKSLLAPVDDSDLRLAGKFEAEGQQNNKETASREDAQEKKASGRDANPGPKDYSSVLSQRREQDFSDRILTLCLLFTIVILFWVAFYQNGLP